MLAHVVGHSAHEIGFGVPDTAYGVYVDYCHDLQDADRYDHYEKLQLRVEAHSRLL